MFSPYSRAVKIILQRKNDQCSQSPKLSQPCPPITTHRAAPPHSTFLAPSPAPSHSPPPRNPAPAPRKPSAFLIPIQPLDTLSVRQTLHPSMQADDLYKPRIGDEYQAALPELAEKVVETNGPGKQRKKRGEIIRSARPRKASYFLTNFSTNPKAPVPNPLGANRKPNTGPPPPPLHVRPGLAELTENGEVSPGPECTSAILRRGSVKTLYQGPTAPKTPFTSFPSLLHQPI